MRARFAGGALDGQVREGICAHHYVNGVPKLQAMTAERTRELLAMHPDDRPPAEYEREFYKRSVVRNPDGKIVEFVYTLTLKSEL